MADRIHIVPHFHWDREWYFTAEESRILLVRDMEEVLTMLETRKEYPCFVLDGQTSVLEDYFSVKPENYERVRRLVKQGKLIIGPWYTQTDEMVVGGESIIRNLLYGMMDCEKLGPRMDIGYLPDSFGQTARLPQILNGFGIKRCIFWRGTSERMGTDKTEFYWEGPDGSKVLVQLLPLGYAIGKYLPTESDELKTRLDKYLPVLDKGAAANDILLPNGHDQMPIQKDIFQVMEQIKKLYPERTVSIGRYEEVFRRTEELEGLDTLRGEFLDGKYMRVHRSIYSSRADLKSANTRIENKVTNLLEPLMSIAYSLGIPYEHGLMEQLWKELLQNHAHDSIGCCCSDKVHRAIGDRFFLAEERADQLMDFYMRQIVDSMDSSISVDKLTAFNLLAYERTEVITGEVITRIRNFELEDEAGRRIPFEICRKETIDPGLIDRQIVHYGNYEPFVKYQIVFQDTIPAMGYRTYFLKESQKENRSAAGGTLTDVIENRYYKIEVLKNGTLCITDKERGNTYSEVLLLEDGSDDGDGYDYSPLEEDFMVTGKDVEADVKIHCLDHMTKAVIRYSMPVPKNLESRKKRSCDVVLDVLWNITLKKDSRMIEITAEVHNHAKDHRLRVLVPNGMGAQYSICDNQLGIIRRPVKDPGMEVWEKENWSERPDSIYPFLSYVHPEGDRGIAVLTNSVREYEMTGREYDTTAITLFRCVGVLGKENLCRRPGRPSGIKMETPDSQMQGVQRFDFALTTWIPCAAQQAKEYITPVVTYNKMPYHAMKLNPTEISVPYQYSLLKIEEKQLILSALKKAEKAEELILRCYNPSDRSLPLRIDSDRLVWSECRLDEKKIRESADCSSIVVEPGQIRTLSVRPEK
ncbi:mannosylglycerate hydrolase [Lacrimispora indolis]|uniref:mannosylglycerate hydrolase n=1 Tax=Lacrimispora indolis TaxID=69825 RepID=UPI00045E83F6|nr:mannosylglycerate hydrolase [Lacrimispora indolis]